MESKDFFIKNWVETFSKEGFKFYKSKNELRKKMNDSVHIIEFEPWSYFIQVSFSYSLILNEVEKQKKKAWGSSYKRFETCGIDKPYLTKDSKDRASLSYIEEDILNTIKEEFDFYKSVTSKYFDNHSSYEFVDTTYNILSAERIPHIAHFNRLQSAVFAIYSASKNNNPNLSLLIEIYRSFLKQRQPYSLERYEEFIELINPVSV